MAFTPAADWRERGLQAQAIKDKCNAIVEMLGLREDDARVQAMIHVRQFCNTLAAVPMKLQQSAERPEAVPVLLAVLGLSSTGDLRSVLSDLNKNAKLSFLTMVQFALEHCVNQILDALTGKRLDRTFRESATRLVGMADIQPYREKLDLLMVPAWMRNTLHSNGVYWRLSKTMVVDGEPYAFVQGKRLESGSWSHIFHAVLCSLRVHEEIFTSEVVSKLGHIQVT